MVNFNQEQRTIEWYRERLGLVTGSKVGVLMKSGRSKDKAFSDTAKTYINQLAGERALNPEIVNDDEMLKYYIDQTTSQSKAMRFGTEQEENAQSVCRADRARSRGGRSMPPSKNPASCILPGRNDKRG